MKASAAFRSPPAPRGLGPLRRPLLVLGAVLAGAILFAPAAIAADGSAATPTSGGVIISTAGDVTLPAGQQADLVFVVNGTATIRGEATTIVAIDGAIDLSGAWTHTIVAIRSPVTLGPGALVEGDVMQLDSAVTQAGDATVQGSVGDLTLALIALGGVLAPALFLIWIGFGLATIVAGIALVAVAPRQVRLAMATIRDEPVLTGLTGLGTIILVPIVAILLIVTLVGAPLGVGILIGVLPLAAFIGYVVAGFAVGTWIHRRIAGPAAAPRPYLSTVTGLLILQLLSLLPVLTILAAIAGLFGLGAVVVLTFRATQHGRLVPTAPAGSGTAPAPAAG